MLSLIGQINCTVVERKNNEVVNKYVQRSYMLVFFFRIFVVY